MSAQDPVTPSLPDPITYGRPRWLAPFLIVAMLGSIAGAVIGYQTHGQVGVASNASVLGNRAVTEQLTKLVREYEIQNHAHRGRNEDGHACLIWLLVRDLRRQGDDVDVKLANDAPCDDYTLPGVIPPLPTTTTTTRAPRRTTATTARHRRQTTTTTTRRTTAPPETTTTTTMCVVRVQGDCAP